MVIRVVMGKLDFEKVVRKRRMIRNFQSRPVSMDLVNSILELAQHAPSAGFSQGWAYVVVTEERLRRKVGEIQGENDFYSKRCHKFISEAAVLIVACVSERVYHDRYREPDKLRADGTEVEWRLPFWYFDIGCACMLIFLAVVNAGLAAAFTGIFKSDDMKRLLGIPNDYQPVGVVSVGYPAEDSKSPSLKRGRKAFDEIVHYQHW